MAPRKRRRTRSTRRTGPKSKRLSRKRNRGKSISRKSGSKIKIPGRIHSTDLKQKGGGHEAVEVQKFLQQYDLKVDLGSQALGEGTYAEVWGAVKSQAVGSKALVPRP